MAGSRHSKGAINVAGETRPTMLLVKAAIDGDGTPLIDADCIVLAGGTIAAIGPADELAARYPDAERLDFGDCHVLPGLVNAHDHVAFRRSRLPLADHFALPVDLQMAFMMAAGTRSLAEGVTTARDMGAPGDLGRRCTVAASQGTFAGPAIVTCIKAITVPGGPGAALSTAVADPAGARLAVYQLAGRGAAFIKVFASTDGSNTSQPTLSPELLRSICLAAASLGLPVVAHATTRESVTTCLAAGVGCIEHGVGIDAALASQMADSGTWFVPTLSGFRVIALEGARWGRAPHVVAYFAAALAAHRRAFEHALAAGVRLAVGTDSLGTMALEIVSMHEYGATPDRIVRAAVAGGAELLGLGGQAGKLTAGGPADLVLVDGDPLVQPAVLGRPVATIRRGALYRASDLAALSPNP